MIKDFHTYALQCDGCGELVPLYKNIKGKYDLSSFEKIGFKFYGNKKHLCPICKERIRFDAPKLLPDVPVKVYD